MKQRHDKISTKTNRIPEKATMGKKNQLEQLDNIFEQTIYIYIYVEYIEWRLSKITDFAQRKSGIVLFYYVA